MERLTVQRDFLTAGKGPGKMLVAFLTLTSRLNRQTLALASIIIALLLIAGAFLAPAYAAELPSGQQDVMIRSTLASFDDGGT